MSIFPTTIVSCYYPLPNAKHTFSFYRHWIYNFLTYVNSPIVLFTDSNTAQVLREMREAAHLGERLHLIEKPFDTLKFSTPEWIETWTKQVELSDFAHLHNQELFRVWANKSFFVEEAIEQNPFGSNLFVWCDAGCWRDDRVARFFGENWPCDMGIVPNRLHILNLSPLDMYFQELSSPLVKTLEDVVLQLPSSNRTLCGGTILVGDKAAWQTWIPTFEETLHMFIKHNLFAGDDQAVITSTGLWLRKSRPDFAPVFITAPPGPGYILLNDILLGDQWFYFQILFSPNYRKYFRNSST